jgi:hypothetical protein
MTCLTLQNFTCRHVKLLPHNFVKMGNLFKISTGRIGAHIRTRARKHTHTHTHTNNMVISKAYFLRFEEGN